MTIGELLNQLTGPSARENTSSRSRRTMSRTDSRGLGKEAARRTPRRPRQSTRRWRVFGPGKRVANAAYTDIYLQKPALKRMKKDPAVTAAVLNALRSMTGIAQAYRYRKSPRPARDRRPIQPLAAALIISAAAAM